jgi:membrane protease YdiL (CAAX protease family)
VPGEAFGFRHDDHDPSQDRRLEARGVEPARMKRPAGALPEIGRRTLAAEVWLVLGLSLGASAVFSVLDLAQSLSSKTPLHSQKAILNAPAASGHSLLDLAFQLAGVVVALVPVALVFYLLSRSGESVEAIGLEREGVAKETAWGAALAAAVGGAGLLLYIGAYRAGFNVRVVPTTLPAVWWRVPVLVLVAVQNGVLEEVVVCGYLLHRLRQLGWRDPRSLSTSALLRGAYHLYQGFGGFFANAVMGLLFGRLYQRRGRLLRLVLAHSLIDTGAFVGYVLLKGHVSWLP